MSIFWKPLKPKSKFLFLWIVSDPQSHNECPHNILSNAACVILTTLNLFGVTLLLFSFSVVSNSLQLHGLQHSRLPCPPLSHGVCSNSYPFSRWCHQTISSSVPLLLPPSIFPSIRAFSNESVLPIRWPKFWSFSFSISSSNEYSRLISFRMDWLDLLSVQ